MKKIPIRTSNAVFVMVIAGWTSPVPEGSFFRRFSSPTRISCLIPCEVLAAFFSSALEVGTLPTAWLICVIARGTTSQRRSPISPATAT